MYTLFHSQNFTFSRVFDFFFTGILIALSGFSSSGITRVLGWIHHSHFCFHIHVLPLNDFPDAIAGGRKFLVLALSQHAAMKDPYVLVRSVMV